MKILSQVKYWFTQLVFLIFFILGNFTPIFTLAYILRKPARKWRILRFFWLFLNDSEGNYIDNNYGDPNWRERAGIDLDSAGWFKRYLISYRWQGFRNPHYNFKLLFLPPKQGKPHPDDIRVYKHEGEARAMVFRNKKIHGAQHTAYPIEGRWYFRKSFTLPLKKWAPTRLFGRTHVNHMRGYGETRQIFKYRHFKYEPK